MVCSLNKFIDDGNERNFKPQKKFLKYKDSLVAKRDILQKFDGEWISWCSDEAEEFFNNYFIENNIKRKILKSSREIKKLSGKCENHTYSEKRKETVISKISVDFEFLERKDSVSLVNEDGKIISKGSHFYICEQN